MVTPAEIGAMQTALEAARQEVERAEQAAGATWLDSLRSLWTVGTAQDSARAAARSARALYDGLVSLRDRAIESADEEHELALQVVEVANRLAGRGTAESIEQLEDAASVSTVAKAAWDGALGAAQLVALGVIAAGALLLYFALRK